MAVRVEAGPKLAGAATQLDGQQAPAYVAAPNRFFSTLHRTDIWGNPCAWKRGRPALVVSPRASCLRSQGTC